MPELTAAMLPGPYRVPAYRGRVRVVLTNKTPCGTYRAPGRFEGTAAREHLLDVAATQLGIDPIELRMSNLLPPAEMPHERPITTLGTDLILDTGDYPALLAAAVEEGRRLGYRALVGDGIRGKRRGFGLAMFVEKSGLGPQETADVAVSRSGAVHVYSGGTSVGQGIETVLAQITADALGVDPRAVRVTAGDTAAQPFGAGSWASRSTVVGAARCTTPRSRSGSGPSSWPRGCLRPPRRTSIWPTGWSASAAIRKWPPSAWPTSPGRPLQPAATWRRGSRPACRPAAASRSRI